MAIVQIVAIWSRAINRLYIKKQPLITVAPCFSKLAKEAGSLVDEGNWNTDINVTLELYGELEQKYHINLWMSGHNGAH